MLVRCWQRARGVWGTERWRGGHGRRGGEERSEGSGEAGKEFGLFSEMGMSVKLCTEQCQDMLDRLRPMAETTVEKPQQKQAGR